MIKVKTEAEMEKEALTESQRIADEMHITMKQKNGVLTEKDTKAYFRALAAAGGAQKKYKEM